MGTVDKQRSVNYTCDGCTRNGAPKCPKVWLNRHPCGSKKLGDERECWTDDPREAR